MPDFLQHGVVEKLSLSDAELADIRALADACTRHEDIDLRLSWGALRSLASDVPEAFLCYRDGVLVGFLMLDGVGGDEAEATGMVLPEYRRRGVFTALVAAAAGVCREAGSASIVFFCDRRSASAHTFLAARGAAYEFSEQKMWLDAPGTTIPHDTQLDFHMAGIADADTITRIIADDSGMDATYFRQIVVRGIQNGSRQFYIAKAGGETIGTINVIVIDGDAYIYGFVVRPEWRGRGYGKQMLAQTIESVVAERPQPIFLEVETDNTPALALYNAFGFEVLYTYDYYRLDVWSQ